jgi:cytochrome c553
MKNNTVWVSVLGVAALVGQAFGGGNPDAGKAKFYTCQGCHSIPSYTNAYPTYHVPKIGGQYEPYVIMALQAYKEGARTHGSMQGNAGAMSDQDMADLAAYVAKFESKSQEGPITGDVAKGKELAAKCAGCPSTQFPAFGWAVRELLGEGHPGLPKRQAAKSDHAVHDAGID